MILYLLEKLCYLSFCSIYLGLPYEKQISINDVVLCECYQMCVFKRNDLFKFNS